MSVYNSNIFFDLLSQGKTKKRNLDEIIRAHISVFPEYVNQGAQTKHLRDLLDFLSQEGNIELPSLNGKAWRDGNPKLPVWIKIIKEDIDDISIIPENYAWHPKLARFVDELNKKQRESAFVISEYLKKNSNKGYFDIHIPRRERSLKIFNDEKRLDSLVNKGTLLSGNLTLVDLGCYDVAWPMPYKKPSVAEMEPRPFLIIENHHTFDSFCKWNDKKGIYSGIGYGSGEAFSSLESDRIEDIIEHLNVTEIHYLGDLDPKGINIPARVNRARIENNIMPILPAVQYYEWLLNNGTKRKIEKGKQPNYIKDWLPESLQEKVDHLFKDHLWIPQESLGLEELEEMNLTVVTQIQSDRQC
ncbi:Wadjet anti-phage system protein JetD domain-containing protein [Methylobacter sp. YRD-M1]|uniref:Wadjet anti-phage system protein JetD domain-containing protein n=1 Tax=Methylobacter sp. YRD-M1 TaxID=2911520 RepID=UPI00227AD6F6|nr:Wadjet anti-phage system protein JetD domain-containing protein [Methylobacter sp. YRD-M1]WAK02244.1 DUF2220 family protein [Methylobacter sp. YRD-M1]